MAGSVTETWQRKRLAPVVTHTREAADAPPTLEELLRQLLREDGLLADREKTSTK